MNCFSFDDFSSFITALRFSAEKHRNQRRKDAEKTPYLNHPVEVADVLWRIGGVRDMPVLTAALLHDVIEDTDSQPHEVESLFGSVVCSLVLEVTDDKSLGKSRRKELQVLHAPSLSMGAKLIKIADKICNVRDITRSPPSGWPAQRRIEYLLWAESVVDALGACSKELEEHFREVLSEGKQEIILRS
ncbi:MAG: HD domain-containing protein [Syntrophobacteraceae bacterium]